MCRRLGSVARPPWYFPARSFSGISSVGGFSWVYERTILSFGVDPESIAKAIFQRRPGVTRKPIIIGVDVEIFRGCRASGIVVTRWRSFRRIVGRWIVRWCVRRRAIARRLNVTWLAASRFTWFSRAGTLSSAGIQHCASTAAGCKNNRLATRNEV